MVDVRMAAAFGILGMLLVGGIAAEATDTIDVIPDRPDGPNDNQSDDDGLPFTPNLSDSTDELNVSEVINFQSDEATVSTNVSIELSNLEKEKNYTVVRYNKDGEYEPVERFNSGSSGLQIVSSELSSDGLLRESGYLFQLYQSGERITDFTAVPKLSLYYIDNFNNEDGDNWFGTYTESDGEMTTRINMDRRDGGRNEFYLNRSIDADRESLSFDANIGSTNGPNNGGSRIQIGSEPQSNDYGMITMPEGESGSYDLFYSSNRNEVVLEDSNGSVEDSLLVPSTIDEFYTEFDIQYNVGGDCCYYDGLRFTLNDLAVVPKFASSNWGGTTFVAGDNLTVNSYDLTDSTPSQLVFSSDREDWTKFPSQIETNRTIHMRFNGDPQKFEIAVMKSEEDTQEQKSILSIFG